MERTRTAAAVLVLAVALAGCRGDSPLAPSMMYAPPAATPTPPAAAITAVLTGPLVLRPAPQESWSGESRAFTLEVPLRIHETGGGGADWHYARLRLFRDADTERGVFLPTPVEVSEVGSPAIAAMVASRIEPDSTTIVVLPFHCSSGDITTWELRLGFGDVNWGVSFEVEVPAVVVRAGGGAA